MSLLPTIRRPALIEELSVESFRVVKLIAPAGYGKSTLVHAFLKDRATWARVDLQGVNQTIDIARRVAVALSALQSEPVRKDFPDHMIGLGDDADGWEQLAASFVASAPGDTIVHLENAEALADRPDLQRFLEHIVTQLPEPGRIIICSRTNVLHFGRFAGPDRSRILSARDLRLSSSEIAALFRTLGTSRAEIASIERFTQGWPIVVMMLFTLAKRGRLDAYLAERDDASDLCGYLANEVFNTLPELHARVLEALTAVPDIREEELALLFPEANIGSVLHDLQSETPFVIRGTATIDLHPAMREMLSGRCDVDRYRARLFESVSRADGGARAARIAILRSRPLDAGRAIAECALPGGWWSPSYAEVFSELPESVFSEYPALWAHASWVRSCHDAVATLQESQRLLKALPEDAPAQLRIDLMLSVIQLLLNRGQLGDAQELTDRFITHPALAQNELAAVLREFFTRINDLYRGDPVDIVAFQKDFAELFLASPIQQAFRDVCILAPYHRTHGDYDLERAALQRGIEIARGTNVPFVRAVSSAYGAMSAWFWGDDSLFEEYVAELEAASTPSVTGATTFFIDCARGRGHAAKIGSEKLDMRTYAYGMAASHAKISADRRAFAEAALLTAQQSSQRLCEAIARVILSYCDSRRRSEHLDRADVLAREMESTALATALEAIRCGKPAGTMLGPLAARFAAEDAKHGPTDVWTINLREGVVTYAATRIALAPREFELLTYLAVQSSPVDGVRIAASLWPESAEDRRALSLRATVNRLRRRLGDSGVVIAGPGGYTLGIQVSLNSGDEPPNGDVWPPATIASWNWKSQFADRLRGASASIQPSRDERVAEDQYG